MVSLFVRALGNCKDCDKRTTETGKSRKLFEKLLFMAIRPEFKTVGCFDRFVQVLIAVSVVSLVSFRCFGGFVSVFRWFRRFRWFRSGGFVSLFRVLVHALFEALTSSQMELLSI